MKQKKTKNSKYVYALFSRATKRLEMLEYEIKCERRSNSKIIDNELLIFAE